MLEKRNIKSSIPSSIRKQIASSFLLFVWSISLFSSASFATSIHSDAQKAENSYKVNHQLLSDDFDPLSRSIFGTSFLDTFSEESQELSDDNHDTFYDDFKRVFKTSIVYHEVLVRTQMSHLAKIFYKKKEIPLFLLFHSWKIYTS